jgi:hypothetical protein
MSNAYSIEGRRCTRLLYGKGLPAWSPNIGAQAGANDLALAPGFASYPAANATVYRVYEYAVPVTTVATVPSAYPTTAGIPGIAAYPGI